MTDEQLLQQLKVSDVRAIKTIVEGLAEELTVLAYLYLKDWTRATVTVDAILSNLFDKDYCSRITPPIDAFLIAQVRAACGY